MKIFSVFLIVAIAMFSWYQMGSADPDSVLEKVLYEGTIPKGQKQLIKSSSGKIQFSYRLSSSDRSYGDNQADCVNGNVISNP